MEGTSHRAYTVFMPSQVNRARKHAPRARERLRAEWRTRIWCFWWNLLFSSVLVYVELNTQHIDVSRVIGWVSSCQAEMWAPTERLTNANDALRT